MPKLVNATPAPALADALVKSGEFASALRVSRSTFRRWRKDGSVPAPTLVGKSMRWRKADVDAVISGAWRPAEKTK